MLNTIAQEQDNDNNLKLIAAHRTIYSKAKKIFIFQIIFSGPIVIILTALSIYNINLVQTINTYCFILSILEIGLFSRWITNLKTSAASIQEKFDCDILHIPWNVILVPEQSTVSTVNKYSKKILEDKDDKAQIMGWYNYKNKDLEKTFPQDIPYFAARIVAQKYNTNWDMELRKSLLVILNWLTGFMVFFIVCISFINKASVPDLTQMFWPIFPITILLIKYYYDNNDSTKKLDSLKRALAEAWTQVLQSGSDSKKLLNTSRTIQDSIYLHRLNSPLIFDRFYRRKRNGQQDDAADFVEQLTKDYMLSHSINY